MAYTPQQLQHLFSPLGAMVPGAVPLQGFHPISGMAGGNAQHGSAATPFGLFQPGAGSSGGAPPPGGDGAPQGLFGQPPAVADAPSGTVRPRDADPLDAVFVDRFMQRCPPELRAACLETFGIPGDAPVRDVLLIPMDVVERDLRERVLIGTLRFA